MSWFSRNKSKRCAFFKDDGQPIQGGCRRGKKCMFVHPEDPDWEEAKSTWRDYHRSGWIEEQDNSEREWDKGKGRRRERSRSHSPPPRRRHASRSPPPNRRAGPRKSEADLTASSSQIRSSGQAPGQGQGQSKPNAASHALPSTPVLPTPPPTSDPNQSLNSSFGTAQAASAASPHPNQQGSLRSVTGLGADNSAAVTNGTAATSSKSRFAPIGQPASSSPSSTLNSTSAWIPNAGPSSSTSTFALTPTPTFHTPTIASTTLNTGSGILFSNSNSNRIPESPIQTPPLPLTPALGPPYMHSIVGSGSASGSSGGGGPPRVPDGFKFDAKGAGAEDGNNLNMNTDSYKNVNLDPEKLALIEGRVSLLAQATQLKIELDALEEDHARNSNILVLLPLSTSDTVRQRLNNQLRGMERKMEEKKAEMERFKGMWHDLHTFGGAQTTTGPKATSSNEVIGILGGSFPLSSSTISGPSSEDEIKKEEEMKKTLEEVAKSVKELDRALREAFELGKMFGLGRVPRLGKLDLGDGESAEGEGGRIDVDGLRLHLAEGQSVAGTGAGSRKRRRVDSDVDGPPDAETQNRDDGDEDMYVDEESSTAGGPSITLPSLNLNLTSFPLHYTGEVGTDKPTQADVEALAERLVRLNDDLRNLENEMTVHSADLLDTFDSAMTARLESLIASHRERLIAEKAKRRRDREKAKAHLEAQARKLVELRQGIEGRQVEVQGDVDRWKTEVEEREKKREGSVGEMRTEVDKMGKEVRELGGEIEGIVKKLEGLQMEVSKEKEEREERIERVNQIEKKVQEYTTTSIQMQESITAIRTSLKAYLTRPPSPPLTPLAQPSVPPMSPYILDALSSELIASVRTIIQPLIEQLRSEIELMTEEKGKEMYASVWGPLQKSLRVMDAIRGRLEVGGKQLGTQSQNQNQGQVGGQDQGQQQRQQQQQQQ